MPEEFFLDPDALERDTTELRGSGHRLGSAFQKLTGVLDDHHGCWGTDDIGKSFAKNYVDPEATFKQNGKLAVDGITQLSDDIDESSSVFRSVDHDNAVRIDQAPKAG